MTGTVGYKTVSCNIFAAKRKVMIAYPNTIVILAKKMMRNAGEKLLIFQAKTVKKTLNVLKSSTIFQLVKTMILTVGRRIIMDLTVKKEIWTV